MESLKVLLTSDQRLTAIKGRTLMQLECPIPELNCDQRLTAIKDRTLHYLISPCFVHIVINALRRSKVEHAIKEQKPTVINVVINALRRSKVEHQNILCALRN